MQYEPTVDRARLIETVRDAYGIPAQELTFVPVGFVAACYVLNSTDGGRYFIKLWPELRLGQTAATRQYAALTLTRALYDRCLYRRVPYPTPTCDGALWGDLSGTPFAVFPFLPGQAPPAQLPARLLDEFARTIAAIHCATPALTDVLPPRETFEIPDGAGLGRCLSVRISFNSCTRYATLQGYQQR